MRKILSCTGVFLLIVQSFWSYTFGQEGELSVLEDPIPILISDVTETQEGQSESDETNVTQDDDMSVYGQSEDPVFDGAYIVFDTGDVHPIEQLLLITEVYFAGTDERFELYNSTDDDFIGDVQLQGVKSSLLNLVNVSIPAHTARIFGDNMLMVLDNSVIAKNALGLSMTDTSPLNISLLHSGSVIDTFIASIDMVNDAKSAKSSIQKLVTNKEIVLSPPSHNYNNTDEYTINPGIVYESLESSPPSECQSQGSNIQITEIFWGNEGRLPYIEIYSNQAINQNIVFSGTQLIEEFMVYINQPAGHYHIITTQETGYNIHPYHSDNQKLSFSSELGNIVIYGQSGQVLDKVDIVARDDSYATYVQGFGCERMGTQVDEYTPGFPREYLSYFPQGAEKVVTVTQQIVVPGSENNCSMQVDTGSVDAIATGDLVMKISYVDYDPVGSDTNNESITIRSLVDYPLDLSLYALRLSTRNGFQYLRGVLEPEEEITLIDNFRFPNAGACIDLLYADFVVDTYCYPLDGDGSGEISNDYSDISITIDSLVYDPPGDDTNNEQIVFTISSGSVDFGHNFYVLINGRKYNLTSFGGPHTGTFTITANYRMPNTKDACVSLMQGDFVFDTKCYTIPTTINLPQTKKEQTNPERFDYDIRIIDIDYDPEGLDTNNEKITITMYTGGSVDLSLFSISINGTKKKLKQSLSSGETITLTGTYGFPNSKQTCVVLQYSYHIYDTYCYDPTQSDQIPATSYTGVTIEIISVLPNPISNDSGKEWIKLLLTNPNVVDLSQGFSLRINNSNKKINGSVMSGQEYTLTGSFSLPNTASCIALLYNDEVLDTLCYPQAKQGVIYTKNQNTNTILSDTDIGLFNATSLDKFDNKICLTLSDIVIKCRSIPAGKLARRQYEELKLSRNYITMMHDYLYNNWRNIYFNTDIALYVKAFGEAKNSIADNVFTRPYGSEIIPTSDIQSRFRLQYQQSLLQQVQQQITTALFSEKLKQNYQKAKKRYYTKL